MLFHFGMEEDTIKNTFCINLKIWFSANQDRYEKPKIGNFAKDLKVSQGYISNVLAGRKCGPEAWRRFVAEKIGLDYDTMIGLAKKPHNRNIVSFECAEDKQHYYITKSFTNKKLAIEINDSLVKIEQYDPDELEEIKNNINTKLEKLIKKFGKGKKNESIGG